MKNYLEDGETVVIAAPADTASGDFVVKGALYGVAVAAALSGADLVLKRGGAFELPKATGAAWTQGDRLYWDATNKNFTTSAGAGNRAVGIAFAAADSADTTGQVFIDRAGGGLRTVAGQLTTVTATDTVVTGLAKVIAVVASLDDNPGDNPEWVSATIGDQAGAPAAGSVIIKTWQNTAGNDPTPAAATTFGKKVDWIAVGI